MNTILNQKLKKKISSSLKENKKYFKKSSLEFLTLSIENRIYYPILIAEFCLNFSTNINEKYAEKIISQTLEFNNNPEFDEYLIFRLKGSKSREIVDDSDYYREYMEILIESMKLFYSDERIQSKYDSLTNFDCFVDVILDESEVEKFLKLNMNQVFNKDGWLEYYFKLISEFYPDFKFNAKLSDSKKRFLKKLNDNLYIGFEYDVKELKYQFKHGAIVVPELKCILLSNSFDKKAKLNRMECSSFWSLCNLRHPFFYLILSLENIYARSILKENSSGQLEFYNLAKRETLKNRKVRLYNSEEFGDFLQKNCFYELMITSKYNMSFLDYIEKSIIKTLEV